MFKYLKILLTLVLSLLLFSLFTKDLEAACTCNWSFCEEDFALACPFPVNRYHWWGFEYSGSGCNDSSLCDQMIGPPPGHWDLQSIQCSNCEYGYADDTASNFFTQCVDDCTGSGTCYGTKNYGCGPNNGCAPDQRKKSRYCEESGTHVWCGSPPVERPCSCTQQEGLRVEYYDKDTGDGWYFGSSLQEEIGYVSQVNLNSASGNINARLNEFDGYLLRYGAILASQDESYGRGWINLPTAGVWNFHIRGDDGFLLLINGTAVIDEWNGVGNSPQDVYGTYSVSVGNEGWHSIQIDYRHGDNTANDPPPPNGSQAAVLRLEYQGPGDPGYTLVPSSALRSCFPEPSATSCSISVSPVTVPVGSTVTTPQVTINFQNNGFIDRVDFVSNNTTIATVTSPDDTEPIFTTDVTGVATGFTTYTAIGTMNDGVTTCPPVSAGINVSNIPPWFQVKEGDIIALGSISSPVPVACTLPICDPSLITYDVGFGSPGVVAAGGSVTPANQASQPEPPFNWAIASEPYEGTILNYLTFENKSAEVPFNTIANPTITAANQLTGLPSFQGYKWAMRMGDLTITTNDIDIGNNKVVLFVNGNLTIEREITVGQGFFMAVVSGNIRVNPSVGGTADGVPEMEGIYFTGGQFISGHEPLGDLQLHVRGVVVAGSFSLGRNLPDNSQTPAELFEFGPDQMLQLPVTLSKKEVIWREVAP